MRALACLLAVTASLIATTKTEPPVRQSLDDLRSDAVGLLYECDGVKRVERLVAVDRPGHRIVHIADWHTVPPGLLAADLADQGASRDEQTAAERGSLAAVRVVQANQRKLLHWLGTYYGARRIHLEGLDDRNIDAYRFAVRALGRRGADRLPEQLGAAAQALVAGDIDEVLPAEDEAALKSAQDEALRLQFDGPANDRREAAIVCRLVAAGPLAVVMLGGDHDLSAHLKKVGDCEYLRVFVEGYPADLADNRR